MKFNRQMMVFRDWVKAGGVQRTARKFQVQVDSNPRNAYLFSDYDHLPPWYNIKRTRATENALNERGVTTEGTVSRKWTETSRNASSNTRSTTYHVSYSFDGDEGNGVEIIFSEQDVSSGIYNSVRNGGSVTVTFLPDNPNVNRIEARNDEGFILIPVVMFGLLTLLALYLAAAELADGAL